MPRHIQTFSRNYGTPKGRAADMTTTDTPLLSPDQVNAVMRDYPLNANHRCDKCGAQAYMRFVVTETQQDLMFCAHHGAPLFGNDALTIIRDERKKLHEVPAPSYLDD